MKYREVRKARGSYTREGEKNIAVPCNVFTEGIHEGKDSITL